MEEQNLKTLFDESIVIIKQHTESYEAMRSNFKTKRYDIENKGGAAQAYIKGEYEESKSEVRSLREQGNNDDLNVGIQAIGSGDAVLGGTVALLGLINSIDRKRALKEKNQADKAAYTQATRETEMAIRQATTILDAHQKKKEGEYYDHMIRTMNEYLSEPPIFDLPVPNDGVNEYYYFAVMPFYDRLLVSSVIRMDLYNDQSWYSFADQVLKQNKEDGLIYETSHISALKTHGQRSYKVSQGKMHNIGYFSTQSEALDARYKFIKTAVNEAHIPVLPVNLEQAHRSEIISFLEKQEQYWGKSSFAGDKVSSIDAVESTVGYLRHDGLVSVTVRFLVNGLIEIISSSETDEIPTGRYNILYSNEKQTVIDKKNYFTITSERQLIYHDEFGEMMFNISK